MAAKRDKLKFTAVGTAIQGTTIRRIPAVDHFINVFHNNRAGMENIFDFFVMIFKNLLEFIHKTIMKE